MLLLVGVMCFFLMLRLPARSTLFPYTTLFRSNYKQVIPAETSERIALGREEFLQALRRAEIMTSEKSNSVKLAFGRNSLAITANTPEVGEACENLAINYKGEDRAIAFNPAFLIDPLKALDDDEIFFEIADELSPGVIKINGPFLYVIMPMRMS